MANKDKKTSTSVTTSSHYIVGIGTSAGGLEALREFFGNCSPNTGMAFVIVQHLSPNYKSLMPELLARSTSMEIKEAVEGGSIEANHVYLIPSKENIIIENGKLKLIKRPSNSQLNFSIDIFFHSLAIDQKEKAIAVILSGTGSDGTRGGKAIKETGGTVIVQDPESAKFDGMPRSAILNEIADYVLKPDQIPNELKDFISHSQFSDVITATDLGKNMNEIDRVLKILKGYTGYDFFSYKKPTLLRRTAKRMNITKSESIEGYIDLLYVDPDEKFTLVQEFLIGVTKFFRDEEAFAILEEKVVPSIVKEHQTRSNPIKIWVVACSTGEEAYSIAILFEEYLAKIGSSLTFKIFATDIDGRAIDKAAKGFYQETIALDVSKERLSKFFTQKDNGYQISPKIRKNIIFSKHNVIKNPPFSKMDLVSCRNMLIYLDKNAQSKVLSSLHYALSKGGYMFTGSAEHIDMLHESFDLVDQKWKLYKNVSPTRIISTTRTEPWKVESRRNKENKVRTGSIYKERIERELNQMLAEKFNTVCVCVNEYFEIAYAVGKLKKYGQIPEEGFSNNLLEILPDEINIPVSTGIREVNKDSKDEVIKNVNYIKDGNVINVKLIIKLVTKRINKNKLYLIVFLDKNKRPLSEEEKMEVLPPYQNQLDEIKGLREVLNDTKENLQTTIEELETSNEEMQATNEELLASNEELQSTNEELQSLNEELHTVNQELQEKNLELLELNADMESLMTNTHVGMIFLDKSFKIRKFTPAVKDHFELQDSDVGRPIDHFAGSLGGDKLVEKSKKVIADLVPFQEEIEDKRGVKFMLQIVPYYTQREVVEGVTISFIKIHKDL